VCDLNSRQEEIAWYNTTYDSKLLFKYTICYIHSRLLDDQPV